MDDTILKYSSTRHLIAYFSMEIAIDEKIPNYSGGLGVLAGDSLKSFADLNLDVIGITLLSEKGYLNQKLDNSNYQQQEELNWDKESILKKINKQVTINIGTEIVHITAWEYSIVGQKGKPVRIIYLDTNLPENSEYNRTLTSHLYGGDKICRMKQEMILGIGGIKMLRALEISPKKYHMNEGHAAFLTLELLNETKRDIPNFNERYKIVNDFCSFTTHTPVAAGHDKFEINQARSLLGDLYPNELDNKINKNNELNMTLLALEMSAYTNAVARKHRDVSKQMFPNYPIDYITNGVHSYTWTNKFIANLIDKYVIDWRTNPLELRNCLKIPLAELSLTHRKCKEEFFQLVKEKNNIDLDPDVFTIGFARRATKYKRPELIFKDFERLKNISNTKGQLQIVFAGKAHPKDEEGKKIIQHIVNLTHYSTDNLKIVFIQNYDMYIAKKMIAGVDLWLNTPKRPLEASGTSGMKAAHNAVPSLSTVDGWWVEGCLENVTGWSIGDENTQGDDNYLDEKESRNLYEKLEQKILPMFYNDNENYLVVMRNALAINATYFNTHRMAKQYILRAYVRKNEIQNL